MTLGSLDDDDVRGVLARALADERGLAGAFTLGEAATEHVVRMAGGDARRALTTLEAAAGVAADDRAAGREDDVAEITLAQVEQAMAQAAVRYDRAGDQHYDVASAFIKSMRGSDVDAALHYLVGMGDPTALQTAVAAMHAVAQIGMPEARIILGQAVVHNALAPKSNAAYSAINAAIADVRAGKGGPVPPHLRGTGYAGAARLGHGEGYRYTHDEPAGVGEQQFLPDDLVGADYYRPTGRGWEERLSSRWAELRRARAAAHHPRPRLSRPAGAQRRSMRSGTVV